MTPVRTTVIEYLCTAIRTIPDIKTVQRFEPSPVDLDIVRTPATFIYDVLPATWERNNNVQEVSLEIVFVTFIDFTADDTGNGLADFSKKADVLEALIYAALTNDIPSSAKVITDVVVLSSEREVPNEHMGELTVTANVKYRMVRGNAFSTGL